MILLDTNVISESLKPIPSPDVLRWLDSLDPQVAFITTITQAEILYGLELLPTGKRRSRLTEAVHKIFTEDFENRILPFDQDAARAFAPIVAARDRAGHPISQFDAMIAAIARSRQAVVATRNTGDFNDCGIDLVNPWKP